MSVTDGGWVDTGVPIVPGDPASGTWHSRFALNEPSTEPEPVMCAYGHRYEVRMYELHEYDIVCLACGDCRTVRPA